jgi:hypothetical protein
LPFSSLIIFDIFASFDTFADAIISFLSQLPDYFHYAISILMPCLIFAALPHGGRASYCHAAMPCRDAERRDLLLFTRHSRHHAARCHMPCARCLSLRTRMRLMPPIRHDAPSLPALPRPLITLKITFSLIFQLRFSRQLRCH